MNCSRSLVKHGLRYLCVLSQTSRVDVQTCNTRRVKCSVCVKKVCTAHDRSIPHAYAANRYCESSQNLHQFVKLSCITVAIFISTFLLASCSPILRNAVFMPRFDEPHLPCWFSLTKNILFFSFIFIQQRKTFRLRRSDLSSFYVP